MTRTLGIKVDPDLGFPFLAFTADVTIKTPHAEIFRMFAELPPDARKLLEESQQVLFDGAGLMAFVEREVLPAGRDFCIQHLDMTPEAVEFLAAYGEPFIGEMIPHEVLMAPGACFANTITQASLQMNRQRYAEGLALPPVGRLAHHAWCASYLVALDGNGVKRLRAFDYTWTRADYGRYFGIPISWPAMAELFEITAAQLASRPGPRVVEGFLYHKHWCKEIKRVIEHDRKARAKAA